ncbi:Arf guanine nucleotide exchange factor sbh1 [Diaporthe eres]|uniref:Arf guanine nucleotide exchange factor sbh1 n=1 Tax=Diaporthe eres TaxID=83184 RepID=A0ABR1PJC8_DIAER
MMLAAITACLFPSHALSNSSRTFWLYTDESPGLKVDPVVVLVLSLVFIFSVVALHIIAKITRKFSS